MTMFFRQNDELRGPLTIPGYSGESGHIRGRPVLQPTTQFPARTSHLSFCSAADDIFDYEKKRYDIVSFFVCARIV
jgi:hypothetical protein